MTEKDLYFEMEKFKREPDYKNKLNLYNTLKKFVLYVPFVYLEGKTMVATLTKNGKEEFYPGYVSLESLGKWPFELKEIRKLYFDDLKHIMLEDGRDIKGVAVIPSGEVILLENEQIEKIESVTSGISLKKTEGISGEIYLYPPKFIPKGLTVGMELFCRSKSEVKAIYLYQAKRKEKDNLHWMFAVKFNGTKIELFPKLAAVIQLYMNPSDVFELLLLERQVLFTAYLQ